MTIHAIRGVKERYDLELIYDDLRLKRKSEKRDGNI